MGGVSGKTLAPSKHFYIQGDFVSLLAFINSLNKALVNSDTLVLVEGLIPAATGLKSLDY